MYFDSRFPQGVTMDFLVSAFVVIFLGSASPIGALVLVDRHKNPPVNP